MIDTLLNKSKFGECFSKELSRMRIACNQLDNLVKIHLPEVYSIFVCT